MLNRMSKIGITLVITFLIISDMGYAFKMPGGLGGKKGKKAAVAALSYSFTMPEYDSELAMYGVIGAYDLSIAGAPAALKVMEAQIKLATANKKAVKALNRLTDALANKETKGKLEALKKQLSETDDLEEQQAIVSQQREISDNAFANIDAESEKLSEEQAKVVMKAMRDMAINWGLFASAVMDMKDFPDLLKEGLDECTNEIKNMGKDMSALKKIKGIKGNLGAIKAAFDLIPQFATGVSYNAELFKKSAAMLKSNNYKAPSIEQAKESSEDIKLETL